MREKVLELVGAPEYQPVPAGELAGILGLPAGETQAFYGLLRRLEKEGELTVSHARKLVQPGARRTRTANLLTVTKKGAYAALGDQSGDIFIQRENLRDAMPSDVVTVRLLKKKGRLPEGEVVRVVERKFSEFTGTFHKRAQQGYILADAGFKDKIEVAQKELKKAKDGDKVFARVHKYPAKGRGPVAEIIMAYGPAEGAAACVQAVLDRMHVRREFPQAVQEEAQAAAADFTVDAGRLDLRGKPIFTIDGADAKDLDDAVSVEETPDGYRLGVHIADVSHYVRAGSQLDKEAFKRGTSIYYAANVIPMLPKELSNGICSLNPGEDRLTFSCLMELDKSGSIRGCELHKSVIRSRVKGVYTEVNALFAGAADDATREKYREVLPELEKMHALAAVLRAARSKRGALDIETGDCEIIVDEKGIARDVKKRQRGDAEKMIEEFMLCANEAVATFAQKRKLPFVYRIHEQPDGKKIEDLAAALRAAGIDTRRLRGTPRPADISAALTDIAKSPKARALNGMVLRSLAKARYSPECTGHFGLALERYCHFTSPIRRYPDLSIHRILGDCLKNGEGEGLERRYRSFAEESSRVSSEREIAAMQLEWECDGIYEAEYMSFHIGEQFDGVISSVKSFGMYIELANSVEGMARIEGLPGGWYDYDEGSMSLVCRSGGARYTVGDTVRVLVSRAEVATGQIDFELL